MARCSRLERGFQDDLIDDLKSMFPGCMIMKLDASYIQGIPDLLILYENERQRRQSRYSITNSL